MESLALAVQQLQQLQQGEQPIRLESDSTTGDNHTKDAQQHAWNADREEGEVPRGKRQFRYGRGRRPKRARELLLTLSSRVGIAATTKQRTRRLSTL